MQERYNGTLSNTISFTAQRIYLYINHKTPNLFPTYKVPASTLDINIQDLVQSKENFFEMKSCPSELKLNFLVATLFSV